MRERVLLEGRPGVGKTTLARAVVELLRESGVPVAGVVTEELRERGRRVGFALESLDGDRATLAHVSLPGPPRVGRYGVDLAALERVAVPALAAARRGVVVIDELGKMELASEAFRNAVEDLLDGPLPLVATVMAGRHPFTEAIKRRPDVDVVRVTRTNRAELARSVADRLAAARP